MFMRVLSMISKALPFAFALLAGCDGRVSAVPEPASATAPAPPASATAAPPATALAPARDPAQAPGPATDCHADADCVPLTPCGMTEPDMCVPRSQAPSVTAECPRPKPSTYACACEANRCVSRKITP